MIMIALIIENLAKIVQARAVFNFYKITARPATGQSFHLYYLS